MVWKLQDENWKSMEQLQPSPIAPQIPHRAYGKLLSQPQSSDSLFCFAKWDSFNFVFAVCESMMIPRSNLHNVKYNKFLKSQIQSQSILGVQGCRCLSPPPTQGLSLGLPSFLPSSTHNAQTMRLSSGQAFIVRALSMKMRHKNSYLNSMKTVIRSST